MYKVKDGFKVRKIGAQTMAVPTGRRTTELHGMLWLSESGALLWQALTAGAEPEELARLLTEAYEVEPQRAREEVEIYRVPGWRKFRRNDVLVFNFPYQEGRWDSIAFDVTKYFVDRLPPDHRSWGWGGPFFPWATRCCGMKISFFTARKTVYFFRKALTFYQNACMITTVTICNLFVSGCYRSDTDRIQTD